MKTVADIIREIIGGICPRSDIGHIMALLALEMVYEERLGYGAIIGSVFTDQNGKPYVNYSISDSCD